MIDLLPGGGGGARILKLKLTLSVRPTCKIIFVEIIVVQLFGTFSYKIKYRKEVNTIPTLKGQ